MKAMLAVAIIAVLGYLVWERHFSRGAQIEAAYQACMKEFGADKAKADIDRKSPQATESAAAIAKGVTDAFTSLVQGFSGALCGTIKDACRKDYDGQICQALLNRYK